MLRRVFYSNQSAWEKRMVLSMKKRDTRGMFTFSSLDGKKGQRLFSGNYAFLRKKKQVIYLEGQRLWTKANAILRVKWLLGGKGKFLGALHVVPGFIINPIYSLMKLIVRW